MKKYIIHLCALLIIGFIACTKHESNPDDNNEFPLKLKVNKLSNGSIELTWDEVKVTSFSQYTITRQADSTFFSFGTDTTWVIDNYNTTKLIDKNPPFEQFVYYKITAKSNNGVNIRSALTPYEQKDILTVKNVAFSNIFNNLANDEIYLSNNNNVSAYNLKTQTLSKNIIQSPLFNSILFNFYPELPNDLFYREGQEMTIISAKTFKPKTTFMMNNGVYVQSAVSNNDNLYYTTNSDSYGGILVYDATTQTSIQDYKITSFFASTRQLRYLPSAKKLYMIDGNSTNNIMILNLNSSGTISSRSTVNLNSEWNPNFIFSPTQSKIVSPTTGNVYDASFAKINNISTIKNITLASFSPDGKYFAFLDNFSRIKVLETQSFKEIKSYEVNTQFSSSTKPLFSAMGLTNDKVMIIYSRFNSFGARDLNIFFKDIN